MNRPVEKKPDSALAYLESARKTLDKESHGLSLMNAALDEGLGEDFVAAVELILNTSGRVIVSGIGKSGHIARKIAATLASTGTPAIFMHATEASHGDLGMITEDDLLVVLSNSGETTELKDLTVYSRRFNVPLIAITGNRQSALAKACDVPLEMPGAPEACPRGLAPTTSTTMQLAIGDALAIALLEAKGFSSVDFHRFHPGGRLGAALAHVDELMHSGDELPIVAASMVMSEALIIMTNKTFGCLGVVDDAGELIGIVTDGDLRRKMGEDLLASTAASIMTANPKTVDRQTLASVALELLNSQQITTLFVVEEKRPVGIIHIHDLLRSGVK